MKKNYADLNSLIKRIVRECGGDYFSNFNDLELVYKGTKIEFTSTYIPFASMEGSYIIGDVKFIVKGNTIQFYPIELEESCWDESWGVEVPNIVCHELLYAFNDML